ncbi:nucleoside triphosphate pyrophosphohydrolase ham1 [Ceratobasidium sp. 394]|nr:nucleoside triphosphate pyrophosphohydrolase ham1 [Ceratobasidium sp. 394]
MPDGTLTFVTGNANKLREVQEILASGTVPLVIESRNIDLPEIQGTPAEVSREKCRRAAEIVGGPCITEDTSLGFVALNGLPGAYIKWFLSAVGTEGLNQMLDGFDTRAAFAQCNFAFSKGPGAEPIIFEGRTEGKIVRPRGPSKFGWDPVFEPLEGDGKTYAEMTSEAKNKISHRFRSLEKLRKYLEEESRSA